jgi:hypothetical protein
MTGSTLPCVWFAALQPVRSLDLDGMLISMSLLVTIATRGGVFAPASAASGYRSCKQGLRFRIRSESQAGLIAIWGGMFSLFREAKESLNAVLAAVPCD